jgi:hypothetical protein
VLHQVVGLKDHDSRPQLQAEGSGRETEVEAATFGPGPSSGSMHGEAERVSAGDREDGPSNGGMPDEAERFSAGDREKGKCHFHRGLYSILFSGTLQERLLTAGMWAA